MNDRIPPQAIETERTVLSTLLTGPDKIDAALTALNTADFYSPPHKLIFGAIGRVYEQSASFDIGQLITVLKKNGELEQAGSEPYISELMEHASAAVLDPHIAALRDCTIKRKLISLTSNILNNAFAPESDAEAILERAQHEIMGIGIDQAKDKTIRVGDELSNEFENIERMSRGEITGLRTGLAKLDSLTTGLYPGDLTIIAARPSMGKTALAVTIALNVAIDYGVPVLIFSLEMSRSQIIQRMLCNRARISFHMLRSGKLPRRDYPKLSFIAGPLSSAPIFLNDTPGLTPVTVLRHARYVRKLCGGKLPLIIIDYLQLMHAGEKKQSREQEIAHISKSLKNIVKTMSNHMIALSQLSRALEARKDRRPILSDLRESGSIEQDSDTVIALYRDCIYNAKCDRPNVAEAIILKQRNGPTGTIEMAFDPAPMVFNDLAEDFDSIPDARREKIQCWQDGF